MAEQKVSRTGKLPAIVFSPYENISEEFLYSISTAEETWIHPYYSEIKHQSME